MLSVVIPCKDDPMIVECIRTVPHEFRITVVFNGCAPGFSTEIRAHLNHPRVQCHELDEPNLSRALEFGARAAETDWVVFMDADCTFTHGAVDAILRAMERGNPMREVFKGQVVFEHSDAAISRLIAQSRQHHTAEVLTAYKPPLALDRRLADQIGGYLFDWRLRWREDADLDYRLRQAGIQILPVDSCVIHHEALNLFDDLRSTYRYGVGEALADALGKKLTDVPRSFLSTLRSQGVAPATYMLFRNRVYSAGYIWTKLSNIFANSRLLDYDPTSL